MNPPLPSKKMKAEAEKKFSTRLYSSVTGTTLGPYPQVHLDVP